MSNWENRLDEALAVLRKNARFMSCVTHWEEISGREGSYTSIPDEIDPRLKKILSDKGITRLYSHQALCYRHVRAGRSTVVVTPTASGKTLSYNLPILQSLLEHPEFKAMYLFPTKALSQDQQSELNELELGGELGLRIFTYDGDTPGSIRMSVRDEGQIVITNPDMLHSGILPNHPKWIKFLRSLKFVVIDETHTYRGVFGSHMTNLIRRLKRIASFYGSEPRFICCSATIGNPLELAEKLIEEKAELVDDNGSPSGTRHFILYNPPLVDSVQGIRRGVVLESQALAANLLREGVKTIVFARSRVRTELIASYMRETLKSYFKDNHRINIASYRGGYLPSDRRRIEKGLREGEIHGVVSTNALELGIDIGGLDASVLAGFPGSIASTWQQAGRAGRQNRVALTVLIASSAPLDQYIIQHPEYFFTRSPESAYIDPNSIYILMDQLKCAVFELPMQNDIFFKENTEELLSYLEENGTVRNTGDKWYWANRGYPAEKISLRTATSENVVIIDNTGGAERVIGEMDRSSAKMLLHDDAIYMHAGDQFLVKKLDIDDKICHVERCEKSYYTDSIVKTDIKLLQVDREETVLPVKTAISDILVRSQVAKFKKLKLRTHENVGYGDVSLPEEEMHTRSIILIFGSGSPAGDTFGRLEEREQGPVLRGLGYLVKHVAPLFLLCDSRDLGIAERLRDPSFSEPCLYVYDNYPGGSGLSEGLLAKTADVLKGCCDVVANCPCRAGCPSCIGPPDNEISFNVKDPVLRFLSSVVRSNGS